MDTLKTSAGDLEITFIGHGTLMFALGGKVIHVDPWTKLADYSALPKADLILVTHAHGDHLDPAAVEAVKKEGTRIVSNASSAGKLPGGMVMGNGEKKTVQGFEIEAVPAYNLVHMRSEGAPFHPRGDGNGYVINFGDKKIYVAGDTENVPAMQEPKGVYCANLPMNLPHTMPPALAADAARTVNPEILYPYHFGDTDTSKLADLLKDTGIEVRVRKMN